MTEPPQSGDRTTDGDAVVPEAIDASGSKLVYLCLEEANGATITELAEILDMNKLSLYSVLDSLRDEEIVERDGETYRVVDA